jgi:hypothetical protein
MKRILLTLALTASTFAFSQTLQSENFNGLTIGNIGTDITGATAGQGSWLTFSTNGTAPTTSTNQAANNFQVVATGNGSTQGLQIVGPNGDKGSRFMWKDGLDVSWAARTSGNNIIELEYDFFTGAVTTSNTQIGMRIFAPTETINGVPTTRVLNGFVYTTSTRILTGIASLNNNGTIGTFTINLATGGLILNPNTWYTIGCSYNTTTGEVLWKTSPSAQASGLTNTALWIPGFVPNEIDYVQAVIPANATATPPVAANTAASTILFDNYVSRAVATSNLLSNETFVSPNDVISIYPNPATDVLNLKVAGSETITAIQVVDLNGRQMISKTFNNVSDAQIDVYDLTAGMYLINITSDNATITKKFLKQ